MTPLTINPNFCASHSMAADAFVSPNTNKPKLSLGSYRKARASMQVDHGTVVSCQLPTGAKSRGRAVADDDDEVAAWGRRYATNEDDIEFGKMFEANEESKEVKMNEEVNAEPASARLVGKPGDEAN
jgi:hypothetical protein